jgi:hypothetical protein
MPFPCKLGHPIGSKFSEETREVPKTTAKVLRGYPQEKPIKIDHLAP